MANHSDLVLEKTKSALRQAGSWDATLRERIEEFERLCLNEIRSEALRLAVLDYLENTAPIEFFTAPASSSGLHHPYWQSAVGGILLNTSECCIGIDRKMRMHPQLMDANGDAKPEHRDIIYVATILSDTFKPDDAGKRSKEFSHHRTAETKWREVAAKHNLPATLVDSIADAILWHLGRFTPEWPSGDEPISKLSLQTFITHELDMDFSNRKLGEVFQRKGVNEAMPSPDSDAFLQKEFDTSAGYFQHVETKLLDVVRFYATLVLAVVSGIYYIAVSDMFKKAFWVIQTPRAFFIALTALVFFGIGLFFLGMYTELRVRKIRMLEEMAAIRGHYVEASRQMGRDISERVKMVSKVVDCPPFLRRPSEDWYTIILMSFVNAIALATAISVFVFVIAPNWIKGGAAGTWTAVALWIFIFIWFFYVQFSWATVFCYELDCERELKHGTLSYPPKHLSSFPMLLGGLDKVAERIEKKKKPEIIKVLQSAGSGKSPV